MIHEYLKSIYEAFVNLAKAQGEEVNIESDTVTEQGLKVPMDIDWQKIEENMGELEEISAGKILMTVTPDTEHNEVLFDFDLAANLQDSQYKSPTNLHIRRQSAFPSNFAKSRSFGGMTESIEDIDKGFKNLIEAIIDRDTNKLVEISDVLNQLATSVDYRTRNTIANAIASAKSWDVNDVRSFYRGFLSIYPGLQMEARLSKVLGEEEYTNVPSPEEVSEEVIEPKSGIEYGDLDQIANMLILFDNYGKLVYNQDIEYEPHYSDVEEAWSEIMKLAEFTRESAMSEPAAVFISKFYDALSEWTAEDRFDGPKWKIDPRAFNELYVEALEHVSGTSVDDPRIESIVSNQWELKPGDVQAEEPEEPEAPSEPEPSEEPEETVAESQLVGQEMGQEEEKPGDALDADVRRFIDTDVSSVVERFRMSPDEWNRKFRERPSEDTIAALGNAIGVLCDFEERIIEIIQRYAQDNDVISSIAAYETLLVMASRVSKLDPALIFEYAKDQITKSHQESILSINKYVEKMSAAAAAAEQPAEPTEPESIGRTLESEIGEK